MVNKVQYILLLFIISCGVKDSKEEFTVAISDTQFNFHQNTNQLFISTKVSLLLEFIKLLDGLYFVNKKKMDVKIIKLKKSKI